MEKRFDSVLNPRGEPVVGAAVLIKNAGGAVATIYEDDGITEADNPLYTDSNGFFSYYAADGEYSWEISISEAETVTIEGVLHNASSTSGSGSDFAGDLNMTGTGVRFTGDFSNATLSSRTLFKTKTTNGESHVGVIPNGSSNVSGWAAYNAATPTNSSVVEMYVDSSGAYVASYKVGSGSYLPLNFQAGGLTRVKLETDGTVLVRLSAAKKLKITSEDGATILAAIDASGNAVFKGDVTAFGTPT